MVNDSTRSSLPHIPEFDGLRGFLAWWVVIFHLYLNDGLYTLHWKSLHYTVGQGYLAVPVFFALSGFVIAYLADTRHERYLPFLIRRFFRLAPLYYLVILTDILFPWHERTPGDGFWAHVLAHVTMLNGLVPDRILPEAGVSIDFVAWSVTVEWQFYLIAPAVLLAVRRSAGWTLAVIAVLVAAAVVVLKVPAVAATTMQPMIFQRAGCFGLGIGSFYLFKFATTHAALVRPAAGYLLPLSLVTFWACGGPVLNFALIWLVVFSAVLASYCGEETRITRPLIAALRAPVMLRLGTLTYCTYLCHMRVLAVVDRLVVAPLGIQSLWGKFGVTSAVGLPLVYLASEALHRLVERPGIQAGKWLVARLEARNAAKPVVAVAASLST